MGRAEVLERPASEGKLGGPSRGDCFLPCSCQGSSLASRACSAQGPTTSQRGRMWLGDNRVELGRARSLHAVADGLMARGYWDLAEPLREEAFEIIDELYPDTLRAAYAAATMVHFYTRMLKFDEAWSYAMDPNLERIPFWPLVHRLTREEEIGICHGCLVQLHGLSPRTARKVNGQAGVVKGKADIHHYDVAVGSLFLAIRRENLSIIRVAIQVSIVATSKDSWNVTCMRMSGEACAAFTVRGEDWIFLRPWVAEKARLLESVVQLVLPGGAHVDDGPAGVDILRQLADALVQNMPSEDAPPGGDAPQAA